MKKGKKLVLLLTTILMLLGEVGISSTVSNPTTSVVAATRKPKRSTKKYSKAKIWTGDYKLVGNKKSKIFHVIHGHSYRMNRENAVFFKSKAAARAAGYRESKR